MTNLTRKVQRLTPAMCERIDELAEVAGKALNQKVPPTAVLRAAVGEWLATIERANIEKVIEAIRLAIVKRGRKRRS